MPKIMLVEDDNNLREIYGERLMAEGYDIVSANDGEEALALAVKEKPDLILSDVMMPKISGFDMLDILRQTPETKNTKVVMMTALSQTEDKDRAERLGADRYLVKSQVTLEDVARVVHDLLYGETESQPQIEDNDNIEASNPPEPAQTDVELVPEDTSIPEPLAVPAAVDNVIEPVIEDTPVNNDSPTDNSTQPQTNEKPVADGDYQPLATESLATNAASIDEQPSIPVTEAPKPYNDLFDEQKINDFTEPIESAGNPVNPITGTPAVQELTQTNNAGSASAPSTYEETTLINHELDQFANNDSDEPRHSEPLVEPSEQDIIHAKNSSEEPEITKSEFAKEVSSANEAELDSPEITGSTVTHKKVIKPINDNLEGTSTDINALYEKEMREEAADMPISNPNVGVVLDPDENNTNNPISDNANYIAPAQNIDTTQIEGVSIDYSQGNAPNPSDPGHIAL
ncbi:MAG: response regulator [Candidatus Saccharibacteria bacterium]